MDIPLQPELERTLYKSPRQLEIAQKTTVDLIELIYESTEFVVLQDSVTNRMIWVKEDTLEREMAYGFLNDNDVFQVYIPVTRLLELSDEAINPNVTIDEYWDLKKSLALSA